MSGSGICWAICKSAPHPRQPRQHRTTQFFLQAGCPSCRSTNSVKAPKATRKLGVDIDVNANLELADKFCYLGDVEYRRRC